MPDERNPDTSTAVLPVTLPEAGEPPEATSPDLPAHPAADTHDADPSWRVGRALFEVTAQSIPGLSSRVRFPISGGRLHFTGPAVTGFELHSQGVERVSAAAYRALLGRRTHSGQRPLGLDVYCVAGPGRRNRVSRRLSGEVVVNGLSRTVSLRIRLIDVQQQRVLLWLTGPLRLPPADRRISNPFPRVQIAAEFIR
jgi:hypothetical protein